MSSRAPFALLLLAALALGGSAAAEDAPAALALDRLDPQLRQAWTQGAEHFEVIVHLKAAPEARLPIAPRGVAQPAGRLAAVARAVEDGIAETRRRVGPGDLEVTQRLRLQPAYAAVASREALAALLASPRVEWIESDPVWRAHTQQGKAIINADDLHAMGYTGAGYAVAVIDTGVDYNHPALGGGPIPNGKVVYGRDFANRDSDPMDCGDHGTAVASIAAGLPATVSGRRFYGGVAPDASILAYKASRDNDCGSFSSSDVVAAVEDAVLHRDEFNVVAVNMSIGGGFFKGPCDAHSAYASAVDDATAAGIVVVASSGNDAKRGDLSAPACVSNAVSVGAVYDQRLIFDSSYCGNDDCSEILCTDPGPTDPLTITCYSNVNNYLDVLAPSEVATAAEAGGDLLGFGGTSGAAPYVAGAVALLFDARPELDAVQARLLLGLTGQPILEPELGIYRPLIDLAAAVGRDDAAVGLDSNIVIPNGGPEIASSAIVARSGVVESVDVVLKLVHADPEHLRVTLTSPGGTTVVLHDHGPGSTPTGSIDDTLGRNGLFTRYPAETAPAQSLAAFVDGRADGVWTLRVIDDNPTTSGGIPPRLVSWGLGLEVRDEAQPPADPDFFIPVAVHAPGDAGTFWVTDLRLYNPSPSASASAQLYLVPIGVNGSQQVQQSTVTVPPGAVVAIGDVVAERFGGTSVQGNLVVQVPSGDLLATSRTYNVGQAVGTYGQFIGMTAPGQAIGAGGSAQVLLQLAKTAAYRTNLGFSETSGAAATVRVSLYDGGTGAALGSPKTWTVQPYSNYQVNDLFDKLGAPSATNAFARVDVVSGSGRVVSYASVVDNLTGDAIYVPGSHTVTAASFLVPIVARIAGEAGTNWVSDLRVYNPGASAVTLQVEYRPESDAAGTLQVTTLAVPAGRVTAVDDVLGALFGLNNASGSLRLAPQGGARSLLVTSRTFNDTGAGTYGQYIGAVTGGFNAANPAVVLHLESTAGYRSNLGIAEVAGGTATVRYVLKNASGSTLGVGTTTLAPYEVDQINNVYEKLGLSGSAEALRIELFQDSGSGSFTAYGSVVDNGSGDAIYVPAYPAGS